MYESYKCWPTDNRKVGTAKWWDKVAPPLPKKCCGKPHGSCQCFYCTCCYDDCCCRH